MKKTPALEAGFFVASLLISFTAAVTDIRGVQWFFRTLAKSKSGRSGSGRTRRSQNKRHGNQTA
jgi:hypothetical protein